MRQRDEDLRCLRAVVEAIGDGDREHSHFACDAVADMLEKLEGGRFPTLTPRQRAFVNRVADGCDVEPSEGPEDDGAPEGQRFTAGDVPRGKEVVVNVGPRPLRPPGRR